MAEEPKKDEATKPKDKPKPKKDGDNMSGKPE